jgi:hypothetical protein
MLATEFSRSHTRLKWPALVLLGIAFLLSLSCSNNTTPVAAVAPTRPTGTVTETLTGTMAPNGTATRTFTAATAGTVTVTFDSASPISTTVLGLGVGIHGTTGNDCNFTQTVNTPPGTAPQITLSIDAGTYCAGLYDIGNVGPAGITVSLTVTHPS